MGSDAPAPVELQVGFTAERRGVEAINDRDIVYLNVGGEHMTCTRATLCHVKSSILATMFGARWHEQIIKDREGNVFLDWNPTVFRIILDRLRMSRLGGGYLPPPQLPDELQAQFIELVQYLQLRDALWPDLSSIDRTVEKFDPDWTTSTYLSVSAEGRAVHIRADINPGSYADTWPAACGKLVVQHSMTWKLYLPAYQAICLGVFDTAVVKNLEQVKYTAEGTYMWHTNKAAFSADGTDSPWTAPVLNHHDTVRLELDWERSELNLSVERLPGTHHRLRMKRSVQGFRLCVLLLVGSHRATACLL